MHHDLDSADVPPFPSGILLMQLVVTFGLTALFMYYHPVQHYIARHSWTYLLAM